MLENIKMSLKQKLDKLYNTYNRKKYVHPDPVEFLHDYKDIREREIVGLIAASLAYGRVKQILQSISYVLGIMGPSPAEFLASVTPAALRKDFSNFRHRFADGDHFAALLLGTKQTLLTFGSLYDCFLSGIHSRDTTTLSALTFFVRNLTNTGNRSAGHLIPLPERGSACKRLQLFLRWMVRKDAVDPGGWAAVSASRLVVPLDVHMHKVGLGLGFTSRKLADMQAALEITAGFREMVPEDPVRYDFALTRLGIRREADMETFLNNARIH